LACVKKTDRSIELYFLSSFRHFTYNKSFKVLEGLLEDEWGAQGKGLHEKLNSVQASSQPLPEVSLESVSGQRDWSVGRSVGG
jgi:hypothetical protein